MPTEHELYIQERKQQWLIDRQKGLGATDVAAIVGEKAFRSPIDVWFEKTGQAKPMKDNIVLRRGRYLEPLVVEWFTEQTGFQVTHNTDYTMHWHPTIPFLYATLDADVVESGQLGVLECKTAAGEGSKKWYSGIPDIYKLQVQSQMMCSSRDFGYIAWMIDDIPGYAKIEKDMATQIIIEQIATDFWNNHVLTCTPPEAKTLEDYKRVFRNVVQGTSFICSLGLVETMSQFNTIKEMLSDIDIQKKELEERKDELEFVIRKTIGTREIVHYTDDNETYSGIATLKLTKQGYKRLNINKNIINSIMEKTYDNT